MAGVRSAQESDFEAVQRLLDQLMTVAPDRRQPLWTELLARLDYAAWVADVEGQPVGFLDLFVFPDVAHGGTIALINNLVVDQRYRGRGYGAQLLREAIEHCRRQRVIELHVWTDFENQRALGLYKRLSFRERALLLELELGGKD